MTTPAPDPAPPSPPAPQPAPLAPPHENLAERVAGWFRHDPAAQQAAPLIADEAKALLQHHSAGIFAIAGKVFADPALKALAPDMLDLVVSAAHIAGISL